MKKEYIYRYLSLVLLCFGIIFTISGVKLQSIPLSSKSALLIFSTAFIIIGAISFTVHHKRYLIINALCTHKLPIIAHWTYAPNSSNSIKNFLKEEKSNTLATALLLLILSLIFCFVFAYSGAHFILYLGYIFAILCLLTFIIAMRFIVTYYNTLSSISTEVIFGEEYIYFLDQLIPLQRTLYTLEKINIYIGTEYLLILDYGLYDIDDSKSYSITIPIPQDKLKVATYLKTYYTELIKNNL